MIVNAKNIMLTGKKLQFKKYYKPSTTPGSLKQWTAKELLIKSPKMMILLSLRGMLPKNKLRDLYLENVLIYDGPAHDLHNIGLPQFSPVKPINFNEMFGVDFNPKLNKVLVTPESDPNETEKLRKEGYEIIENETSKHRDFWKKEEYTKIFRKGANKFTKKLMENRMKDYKKVKNRGIRYI